MAAQSVALPDTATPTTRATINAANALNSTGPRSTEGKQRVRLNALKHGLYAKLLILPGEDQARFESARQSLIAQYRPSSESETALVNLLHETGWRLDRVVGIEQNLLVATTHQQLENIEEALGPLDDAARYALAQALAYRENARVFAQISREENRLQRLYDRAAAELATIAAARQLPSPPPAAKSLTPPAGFVPATPMPHFTGPLADIKRKQWLRQQATRAGLK